MRTEQHNERTALVQKPLTAKPGSLALSTLKAMMSAKSKTMMQMTASNPLSSAAAAASKSKISPASTTSIIQSRMVAMISVPKPSIWT